jgi:hypothetical protein
MEMPFLSASPDNAPEKLFGLSRHATTPTEGVPLQFRHRTYDDAGSLLRLSAVARNTALAPAPTAFGDLGAVSQALQLTASSPVDRFAPGRASDRAA